MSNMRDMKGNSPDGPHAVDRLVGGRIRTRRRELGISQENLARDLGISFQQVQKYERAANRVSASKLFEIATVLQVPPNYFFEDIGAQNETPGRTGATAKPTFLATPEGAELVRYFPKLQPLERRRLLDLVRVLAEGAR